MRKNWKSKLKARKLECCNFWKVMNQITMNKFLIVLFVLIAKFNFSQKKYKDYLRSDVLLRKDKAVILRAIKEDPSNLLYASESLRKDREVVLAAVKEGGYALKYASESLQENKEFVLAAFKENGYALNYAPKSLKKDKEVVLAAVKEDGSALNYADESLRKDKKFVLAAVKENGKTLEYVDYWTQSREIVLAAVKLYGEVDKSLWNDREFLLTGSKISNLEEISKLLPSTKIIDGY
jgi:hypothetical protein